MPKISVTCPICKQNHILSVSQAQAESKGKVFFLCPALDRRYRLMGFFIDTTRNFYSHPLLKEQRADEHTEYLKCLLGEHDFENKFQRWLNINYPPIGLIDEYPDKIGEIINVYCSGYFYSAVTSASCLAERILNRLILKTRGHFKSDPHYKKIYRKESFDDWDSMLNIISDWHLISTEAIRLLSELKPIRHQSVHYNESYDFESTAPKAINTLIAAITEIFGVLNRKDLYLIFDVPGEIWVRSEAEELPFVREFVLPHCYYAHAVHEIEFEGQTIKKITEKAGRTGKLTDQEFVELRNSDKRQPNT